MKDYCEAFCDVDNIYNSINYKGQDYSNSKKTKI